MTPVILDACVMRSSGDVTATHPTAETCRDLLNSLREKRRHIALTPDIQNEWNRHMSRYARKWLTSMYARKLVFHAYPVSLDAVRAAIPTCALSSAEKQLMSKDIHLIEAVYETDGPVVSMDYVARDTYRKYYFALRLRPNIHWTCPLVERATNFIWLTLETKNSVDRLLRVSVRPGALR